MKKTSVTTSGRSASIKLTDYRLWSPEDPCLYDLEVSCGADQVVCYFGMRKFSEIMKAIQFLRKIASRFAAEYAAYVKFTNKIVHPIGLQSAGDVG